MSPDSPQNTANIPNTPGAAQVPSDPSAMPAGSASASSLPGHAEEIGLQARHLVIQYQNDPYKLAQALQQLKGKYLADNYHIIVNPAEN